MSKTSAKELFHIAEEDFIDGKKLYTNNPDEFKRLVCFSMQQAVEKYIKTYLIYHDKPYKKTHDISLLIQNAVEIDEDFNELYEINADSLTDYAVEIRYDRTYITLSKEKEAEAVFIVEKVRSFIMKKLPELSEQ
jgi:HEPN domain-containing protein